VAQNRLLEEVNFAFTEEGVHKENSPGYHVFMMHRLEKLVRLKAIGGEVVGVEAKKIQDGAERFLEAITLPDGMLPMVGDTRGGQKGKQTEIPEGPVVYDFSKSGYVVVKGKYKTKPYYFLMKNCHDSNYHRHDDDLSIYFWLDGEVLLGDGGLGSHNEKDGKRIQLRSYSSHSVPFLKSVAYRNRKFLPDEPSLSFGRGTIKGCSHMFGIKITREIDISAIKDGTITIIDNLDPLSSEKDCDLSVNFFSQNFFKGDLESSCRWLITCDKNLLATLEFTCSTLGGGLNCYVKQGVISSQYGKFCEAQSLVVDGEKVRRLKTKIYISDLVWS